MALTQMEYDENVKTGTITSAFTLSPTTYAKIIEHTVNVNIGLNSVTASNGDTLATIPEGFRPSQSIFVTGVNSTMMTPIIVTVGTDGKVTLDSTFVYDGTYAVKWQNSISNSNIRINASWETS